MAALEVPSGIRIAPAPDQRFDVLDWGRIAAPLPELSWISEGLNFTAGRPLVFCGEAGTKKSWWAQALLIHASAGREMLGFQFRAGLRCLYIDYEQGERESRTRFQALARGLGVSSVEVSYVWQPIERWNPTEKDRAKVLAEVCALVRGYDIVAVDSLLDCQPGVEENSSEVSMALKLATSASGKEGCGFVFVDHASGKTASTRGNAQRGHSSKKGASSVLLVATGSGQEPVVVTCERSQNAPFARWPRPFAYDLRDVSGGVQVVARDVPGVPPMVDSGRMSEDRAKVLDCLAGNPQTSRKSLHELTGIGERRLNALVSSMVAEGVLVSTEINSEKGGRRFEYSLSQSVLGGTRRY